MAEYPAVPIWTDSYLADTRHLTTEEHGAYLLLLMEAWRRPGCNLPDDDLLLARLAGLSPERWAEVKPVVMAFWQRDGRRKVWTQKRLSRERQYVAHKSKSQRDKAAIRWKKTRKDDAAALPEPCPADAPTPTPTKREAVASLQKKGSRLEQDWRLPKEWGAWAVAEGLDEVTVRREADRFRDYWLGVPGQKGVKTDWLATWRNWVRRALENAHQRASSRPLGAPQIGEEKTTSDGRLLRYGGAIDQWEEVRG